MLLREAGLWLFLHSVTVRACCASCSAQIKSFLNTKSRMNERRLSHRFPGSEKDLACTTHPKYRAIQEHQSKINQIDSIKRAFFSGK